MQNTIYIISALIALAFFWGILIFNILVTGRNHIKNAEAGVEVQLRKRYDLIPNLVATVKGYAAHEQSVLQHITQLRQQALRTSIPHRKQQNDAALEVSMKHLFAVAENYPDLKADQQFLQLQAALNEIEAQLAAARRTYNSCVTEYNNTVESFPSSIIASLFGFKRHRWFEITDEARQNPQVAQQL